jgi:predicted O-methyltransferase YrrM
MIRKYLRAAARGVMAARRTARHVLVGSQEASLQSIDPPFHEALASMYRNEAQTGDGGRFHPLQPTVRISTAQGLWLYDLCLSIRPKATLEIGLAYGFSTLFFLAALAKNAHGRHTAIDPFQHVHWHGIGLRHARQTAPDQFEFIEERSDRAAIDLVRDARTFDLIFIDGNHRFDDVLTDFYLYAPLCSIGGVVIFDDLWMNSVKTAVSFVRNNRADFVEVPAGPRNVRMFRKVSEDVRSWDHFVNFEVA